MNRPRSRRILEKALETALIKARRDYSGACLDEELSWCRRISGAINHVHLKEECRVLMEEEERKLRKTIAGKPFTITNIGSLRKPFVDIRDRMRGRILEEYEIESGAYELYERLERLRPLSDLGSDVRTCQGDIVTLKDRLESADIRELREELGEIANRTDSLRERAMSIADRGIPEVEGTDGRSTPGPVPLDITAGTTISDDLVLYRITIINNGTDPVRDITAMVYFEAGEFKLEGFLPRDYDGGLFGTMGEVEAGGEKNLTCCLRPLMLGTFGIRAVVHCMRQDGAPGRMDVPEVNVDISTPTFSKERSSREMYDAGSNAAIESCGTRSFIVPFLLEPAEVKGRIERSLAGINLRRKEDPPNRNGEIWALSFSGRDEDSKGVVQLRVSLSGKTMELKLNASSRDPTLMSGTLIKAGDTVGPILADALFVGRPLQQVFVSIKDSVISRSVIDISGDVPGDVDISDSVVVRSEVR